MSITVIVNEDEKITTKEENLLQDSEKYEEALPEIINAKDYPVLTSNMLKYLYQNKKSITIKGQDYTIYLKGEDIVNTENELITQKKISGLQIKKSLVGGGCILVLVLADIYIGVKRQYWFW